MGENVMTTHRRIIKQAKETAQHSKLLWAVFRWLDSNRVFWLMLVGSLAFFFPALDGYFRPAASQFLVDKDRSYRTDQKLVLFGSMVKERCVPIGFDVTGYRQFHPDTRLPLIFQDNKVDQTFNRPKGPQNWGPWWIVIAHPRDLWGLDIKAAHLCSFETNLPLIRSITWVIHTKLGETVLIDSIKKGPPDDQTH